MKPINPLLSLRLSTAALLIAAFVLPAPAQDFPTTMSNLGPVGWWRFNENTVSPPLHSITNASAAGPVLNAIVEGVSVTNGQPGIIGTSLRFTETSEASASNTVDVQWSPLINFRPPFSIEFWAKPNRIITTGDDVTGLSPMEDFDPTLYNGGNRSGWIFYMGSNGVWEFRLGLTSGYAGVVDATNQGTAPGSPGLASSNSWEHIVATWDSSFVKLYVNGVQSAGTGVNNSVGIAVSSNGWYPNSEYFLRFGGSPLGGNQAVAEAQGITSDNGTRGFDGYMEEAAIYPYVLSASQVNAHFAAATTNNSGYNTQILGDSPVGYWPMNDPVVVPPLASTFPFATNFGSATNANATNSWGILAAQPGPGYAGLGTSSKAVLNDGFTGSIGVQDSTNLHFSGPITLSAWVKPTEMNFFKAVIEHGFIRTTDADTFLRITEGGSVAGSPTLNNYGYGTGHYYEIGSCDGSTYYDAAQFPIPAGDIGNWVFLAGTCDGVNWNLYRDGVLVSTFPCTEGDLGNHDITGPWTIGSRQFDTRFNEQSRAFAGSISEAAIFTNALTADQIEALYVAAQPPPVFTVPLVNPGTVYLGASLSFSVQCDGAPTIGYLWTSNGLSTGDTTTNFSIPNIGVGTYTIAVTATNAFGTNTDSITFSVVLAPPSITAPPAPEVLYVGNPFLFSVQAGGSTPLTYFWQLGNTIVQSGPSPTYSGLAGAGTAGNYSVIVSNITGTTVTSAPVSLTVLPEPMNYPSNVLASAPVAYWRLNETTGSVAYDEVGGHEGTYFNATLGLPGYSVVDSNATGVAFSGLNSYVGSIDGTAATGINFTGHTNFTLEAWVKSAANASFPAESTIIAKGLGYDGSTTETEQFALEVDSTGVYRFFTATGNDVETAAVATEGPNGVWQHVVGVYDDTGAGQMTIYVNGVAEGSGPTVATGLNDTQTPISIGSKRTGNSPTYNGVFTGEIEEVAIYNVALDGATVFNHYTSAYGTTLAPFFTFEPISVTNYVGLSATLSGEGVGSFPLTYTWSQNNVAVGSGDTLTFSPLTYGNAGTYILNIANNVGSTNSVPVHLTVLPPPTNPPSIEGLVLHLTFDGTLADATGRGNGGIGYNFLSNADTTLVTNVFVPSTSVVNPDCYYAPDGVLGQAFHYTTYATTNGTGTTSIGTNDYYVSLGVKPDLQFSSNVSLTVAYWIRLPFNFIGGDLPFFATASNSTFGTGLVFTTAYGYGTATPNPNPAPTSPGSWGMSVFGSGGGVGYYGLVVGSLNDGGWHHLAHVMDRNANTVTTYLDGLPSAGILQTGSTTLDASASIDSGYPATIGQDPTGHYGESGSADIEDLGIWRKALTSLEVGSIYIAATSNKLSYVAAPINLTVQKISGSNVVFNWGSVGTLQTSTNIVGAFTNVPNAVSPFTNTLTGPQRFYRVKL